MGKVAARDLAIRFGSISALAAASFDELLSVDEIGEVMANSILEYFSRHADVLARFQEIGIDPIYKKTEHTGFFAGKKVVLTGKISLPRSRAAQLLTEKGATVVDSVSKDTDIVIAGEDAGSKLDKAKKYGLKIIGDKEFSDLINA